ncbi:MAG: alpha/beta fold hydrolase [Armatimonadetes bacterium]|nr:alpha/beta fold hydrolase [Armatimonadota bacterium]
MADVVGIWSGSVEYAGSKLPLIIKIARNPEGGYTATLDSPSQGATDIPFDSVAFDGKTLRLELTRLLASYEGTISDDGSVIIGEWRQGGITLPLSLDRMEKAPEPPARPQEPKEPYPYVEEEVTYESADGSIKFAGTLTMPDGDGPFPAVLLISGSGQQDRNETILGHKPFWVLADYLTRHGIAVLRVDDRGVGGTTGNAKDATSEDFAGDVLEGVRFLKTRKGIDAKQIGLIGHSEGGLIAPMAAVRSQDVSFIVLLAGPGVSGAELLPVQIERISLASGLSEADAREGRELQERVLSIVVNNEDEEEMTRLVREVLLAQYEKLPDEQREAIDVEAQIEQRITALLSPWFRYFLKYDPAPTLKKVQCPVLAVNGELDTQVDAAQNLLAVARALEEGGNSDYTIIKFPNLNHLFQTAKTGSPAEYMQIEETFSPVALRSIADWILRHTEKG